MNKVLAKIATMMATTVLATTIHIAVSEAWDAIKNRGKKDEDKKDEK